MNAPDKKAPGLGTGGERAASTIPTNHDSTGSGNILPDAPLSGNGKELVPDTADAISTLKGWRANEPTMLASMDPSGGAPKVYVADPNVGPTATWIAERQGLLNLYWTPNRVLSLNSKPNKGAVLAFSGFWVDVDPQPGEAAEDVLHRVRAVDYPRPPTVTLISGGGVQMFWKLRDPLEVGGSLELSRIFAKADKDQTDDDRALFAEHEARLWQGEGRCAALALTFNGDVECRNADRLMRLPGTWNIPTKAKIAAGRTESTVARLVEVDWSRLYDATDFPLADAELMKPQGGTAPKVAVTAIPAADVDLDALPVSDATRALIVNGGDPDDLARWADRSDAVWHVTCELLRSGVADDLILGVLLDPDLGISAHIYAQPKPEPYARRQIERAREDVASKDAADNGDDFDKVDGKIVANSQRNIRLAIRKLGVRVRFDLFSRRAVIEGLEGFGPHIDDAAVARLWLLIDEKWRFRPSWDLFQTVLADAAHRDSFHPVRDYLDGLTWDGTPRLEGWLTTYGKAEDTPYTRAVGKLVLVAAVRRVREPGVKFDEMLVLESVQGKDKSSALAVLAIHDDWFSDSLPLNADDKLVIEKTAGKWIVESGELNGITKAGVGKLKNLLSRRRDESRMAYGRNSELVPRQWVMIGTTNDAEYLHDQTGNRRFWPVAVEVFDLDALRRDSDQIWGEAAHLEAQGVSIRLDPAQWAEAEAEQDARRVEDPFFEALHHALGEDRPGRIPAVYVWQILGSPMGNKTQAENARMGAVMRRLGFDRKQLWFEGRNVKGYVRGESDEVLWSPTDPPWDQG